MHICKEQKFFQNHIHEYEAKESHEGKPLRKHCEEVLENFNRLYKFYGLDDGALLEAGHYLAYYHDLGKLDKDWDVHKKSKPPHSPKSLDYLFQHHVNFCTNPKLTPLLWYLVLKHHGKLTLPEKMGVKKDSQRLVRKFLENKGYWSELQNLDLVGVSDIFGLFKIADALSASKADSSRLRKTKTLMIRKPKYNEHEIRSMIKEEDFSEERWKDQLKIRGLPEVGLLRAPTGWGKTTVALLFSANKPCNRVFYLLPTITAINKFYKKLRKSFKESVSKYFYFYDTEIKDEEEKLQTMFFTQNFLTPIVVTTVDQFLLSFLQCGKYNSKRVAFRNSAVILDEVHLLNPLMLNILSYLFQKFRYNYKMKLLLMSATLPEAYREYFSRRLNIPKNAFLDFGKEYEERRRVVFDLHNKDITTAIESIYQEYKKGQKVLVVVNTVRKAIEIGRNLREKFSDKEKDNLVVFHARFMYCDRKNKEEFLEKMVNKNKPHILVATQVCEVSLDISYDILYTEVASLASVIQRFGRVNRKGKYVEKVNAHMYFPKEVRDQEEVRRYPYEEWEIDWCWTVLDKLKKESLKNEKQLIDEFDKLISFEKLEEELKEVSKKIKLDVWEAHLQMFYSLDVAEEELKNILEYRDSLTTLIIPSPEMISEEKKRKKLESLKKEIEESRNLSFEKKMRLFSAAKEMSVPVPIWWIKGKEAINSCVFPVVYFEDKTYDSIYGMLEQKINSII